MDLSKLTPEGLKLFNENPDKTPEQLAELGLSTKDYEVLTAKPTRGRKPKEATPEPEPLPPPVEKIQPKMVQPTRDIPQHILQPQLDTKGGIRLYNKKKGSTKIMDSKMARMLAKKYPNEYEIVR